MTAGQKVIQQQLQSMMEQIQSYNRNKSTLGEGPSLIAERIPSSSHSPTHLYTDPVPTVPHNHLTNLARVEFPRFNGDEPRAWVRKCLRYFQIIYTVLEDQKVHLASIHLDGRAELWFQSLIEGKEVPTWNHFVQAVYERVRWYEDLKAQVTIYNPEFSESYYVHCFISGLRDDIKSAVLSLRPTHFQHAVSLAINQERTVDAILKRASNLPKTWPNTRTLINPKPLNTYPPLPKPNNLPLRLPRPPEQSTRRLLTEAEMQARRAKNLYYNCDEIFKPGHKCKQLLMYCIMTEEEAADLEQSFGDGGGVKMMWI
ncbi:UNVERIFIED_CONTAM: hypothetical protein Sradi_1779400 [Sesamum radiatum]|uniref:Retrotransposon gag domain-containing protein n=1 Tax=Sesamum radiatum TaxID=300843 RepID=A0AAW2TVZ0_SESRA